MADLINPYPVSSNQQGSAPVTPYQKLPQGLSISSFAFWMKPVLQDSNGNLTCPGVDGPLYASNPYDTVYIGGNQVPGIVELEIDKEVDIDRKKAHGSSGERLTAHGLRAARVDMRVRIWTPAQLQRLQILWFGLFINPNGKTQVQVQQGKKTTTATVTNAQVANAQQTSALLQGFGLPVQVPPTAINPNLQQLFDVRHPLLNELHGIKSLMINGVMGPVINAGVGVFTIKGLEYQPPTSATQAITTTPTQPMGSQFDPPKPQTPGQNSANTAP